MAIADPPRTGSVPYRLSVGQFQQMIDAGIFPPDKRVELLAGYLVDKMTKNEPHDYAVDTLAELLRGFLAAGWRVREEKALILGRWSRPEPDLAVVAGPRERYRARSPRPVDAPLVVEVADTTYPKDRYDKWPLYAGAGVPCYWIVNIPGRHIEVYTEPKGRGDKARYHDQATYGEAQAVPVVIEGREVGRAAVRDLLP